MIQRFVVAIPLDDGHSLLTDEPMLWFTGEHIWEAELWGKGYRISGPLHMKLMHHFTLPITYLRVTGPAMEFDVVESDRI